MGEVEESLAAPTWRGKVNRALRNGGLRLVAAPRPINEGDRP